MMDFFRRRNIHEELHYWLVRLARRLDFRPPFRSKNVWLFAGAASISTVLILFLQTTAMPPQAVYMAGIFCLAALLWSTEALPLFATALLVIGLEVILIANPGDWAIFEFDGGPRPDFRLFLSPFADPIIILFLGGFLLAQAAIKEGVDSALAGVILRLFRGDPSMVMLGLMLVTSIFSMFMSNTATAAMMITLVVPMLSQIPKADPIRKALVLSIPFAANIGGMGTPIASPPNAVAVGFLQNAGYEVSFLEWMLVAVPLVAVMLLITWLLLRMLFRSTTPGLILETARQPIDGRGWFVIIVFGLTVLLWLTDRWHGLPAAVVALVPAVTFTTTGLLARKDYNSLEWHILTLIAGGIALGTGMQITGLDRIIVDMIPASGIFMLAAMAVGTVLLSTFMSNTAAANLLLPIGVGLATSGLLAIEIGITIALAASMAMALPVSTPPNAIAYAHGEFETRDIIIAGSLVGIIALVLIVLLGPTIVSFWVERMAAAP